MTKTNKTVGKTTTKSTKKGGTKMDVLKKLQLDYNNSQSYNKEHELTFHFLGNDTLEQLRNKLNDKQLEQLTKAYEIIDAYKTFIYKALDRQYRLNKTYGKTELHLSELSNEQLEELQKKAAKEAEYRSMRKEVK